MVAAQTTDWTKREYLVEVRVDFADSVLKQYAGSYVIETETPLSFVLKSGKGRLLATIPDQFEDMEFFAESEMKFFATAPPFELVFTDGGRSLTPVMFGAETKGQRVQLISLHPAGTG